MLRVSCASLAIAQESRREQKKSREHNFKPIKCWRHAATQRITVVSFRRTGLLSVSSFVVDAPSEPGQLHLAVLGPWNREDGAQHDPDEVDDKRDVACAAAEETTTVQ